MEDRIIEDIINIFRPKNENERIKHIIIRYLKKLEWEDCYETLRAGNFYSNNYFECESNDYRNKTITIKEYLDEIKLCLKD